MTSDLTDAASEPAPFDPDDWVTAAEAVRLVRAEMRGGAGQAIAKRALAGLLRSRAALLQIKNKDYRDCELPTAFWWAGGDAALEQNWAVGDFSTWINREYQVKAFGVLFHRGDVAVMVPNAFKPVEPVPAGSTEPNTGGRRLSALWPDWVAELAAHIHAKGFPAGEGSAGQDELIGAIEAALAERGLEAPGRTTVQETVRKVLVRLRQAGNSPR